MTGVCGCRQDYMHIRRYVVCGMGIHNPRRNPNFINNLYNYHAFFSFTDLVTANSDGRGRLRVTIDPN